VQNTVGGNYTRQTPWLGESSLGKDADVSVFSIKLRRWI
jgi:hypothetical protein